MVVDGGGWSLPMDNTLYQETIMFECCVCSTFYQKECRCCPTCYHVNEIYAGKENKNDNNQSIDAERSPQVGDTSRSFGSFVVREASPN